MRVTERTPIPPPIDPDPLAPDVPALGDIDAAAGRALHGSDRVPVWLMRGQSWFQSLLSNESRIFLGIVIVLMAMVAVVAIASTRLFTQIFEALNIVSMVGLFLVNWLGNGGALVPIPGARFIGLLMIFQHSVMFPSWEVFLVSGAAMALGLASYYVAGARAAERYERGDTAGAQELARDTGMLDDEVDEGKPPLRRRLYRRFDESFKSAQARAQPTIEKRGLQGMALLCFAPLPLGTAAAFLGGLMRFGFPSYLAASFGAKYLLAGIIVVAGLVFSEAARAVQLPDLF
jgi:hypothetical protein